MKLLALLPLLLAVVAADSGASLAPRVVVLGTVQDGGMPQTGCDCSNCSRARKDPRFARHVASLTIHVPKTGHVYLVDAATCRSSKRSASRRQTALQVGG